MERKISKNNLQLHGLHQITSKQMNFSEDTQSSNSFWTITQLPLILRRMQRIEQEILFTIRQWKRLATPLRLGMSWLSTLSSLEILSIFHMILEWVTLFRPVWIIANLNWCMSKQIKWLNTSLRDQRVNIIQVYWWVYSQLYATLKCHSLPMENSSNLTTSTIPRHLLLLYNMVFHLGLINIYQRMEVNHKNSWFWVRKNKFQQIISLTR